MSRQPIDIHYAKMKEWLEDRASLFGKKHVKEFQLCVSLAPQLVQAVRYDIPALKKTMARLTNLRAETLAAIEDAPKAEQQHRNNQRQILASYGLPAELLEQCVPLEALVDARVGDVERSVTLYLAEALPRIVPSCFALYEKQLEHIRFGKDAIGITPAEAAGLHFPWLTRAVAEATQLAASAMQSNNTTSAADGGATTGNDAPTLDIDWGDDDSPLPDTTVAGAEVAIQWDDDAPAALDGVGPSTTASNDDDDDKSFLPPAAHTAVGGVSITVARADHRAALVHELTALQAFLDEHVLDTLQRDSIADTAEQRQRHCPALAEWCVHIQSIIRQLTHGKEAELLRMRNNFRLKEKLINSVEDVDRAIARVKARASAAEQQIETINEELAKIVPQIESLVATSKAQQRQCEEALQLVFPDREVLIVGDVNSL
jgi:hypothetical protein